MKVCSKCKVGKALEDFPRKNETRDGRRADCSLCNAQSRNEHYKKNKGSILGKQKCYNKKNRERVRLYKKKYYQENKNKINLYANKRRVTNLNFKLRSLLRVRVRNAMKRESKSALTMALIGCSVEQVRAYLESKFLTGMDWGNHGLFGWHIDHIRPCSSFDLTDPEQQKACFHYSNLQPLWAADNLTKSDSYFS